MRIYPFLARSIKTLSSFLFPPLCATCEDALSPEFRIFCDNCLSTLSLVEYEGRCHRCFAPREGHDSCPVCRELPGKLRQQAFCFEESLVSHHLLSRLKEGIGIEAAAGYIVLQLTRLRWPTPDLVVPIPGDWFEDDGKWTMRKLLAKEVARILGKKYGVCAHLERHLFPIPYEHLESQPQSTPQGAVRASTDAINKHVLLIHDTYITGKAISLTSQALDKAGALSLYAMSFVASSNVS